LIDVIDLGKTYLCVCGAKKSTITHQRSCYVPKTIGDAQKKKTELFIKKKKRTIADARNLISLILKTTSTGKYSPKNVTL